MKYKRLLSNQLKIVYCITEKRPDSSKVRKIRSTAPKTSVFIEQLPKTVLERPKDEKGERIVNFGKWVEWSSDLLGEPVAFQRIAGIAFELDYECIAVSGSIESVDFHDHFQNIA